MIPQLLLEEILLGEKNEKDYYKEYGKDAIQAALSELKKSNEQILSMYPPDEMQDKFIEKAFAAKNKENQAKAIKAPVWKFSLAAMLALAFVGPLFVRNFNNESQSGITRVKGNAHHQLKLYRQKDGQAQLLKNGSPASENDLIQITYTPGLYNYGLIFSVDGNGNVTRHFPENSWTSQKLEKTGEEVPLSFSYSLDDAPEYECFIFVASEKEFNLSKIEEISKESFSIDFLKEGSYLPKDCDGSIFVLNKE